MSHYKSFKEHRFKHSFQDRINPLRSCGSDVESTEHILLHCSQFALHRTYSPTLFPICTTQNMFSYTAPNLHYTEHILLHCSQFAHKRRNLLSTLGNFNYSLLENTSNILTQTLLFGNMSLSPSNNSKIFNAIIDLILSTKRFGEQFF